MLCKDFFYISIHIHPVRLVFVLSLEIAGRFHPDCQYIDPRTLVKVVIVTPCLFPSPMEYFVLSCCRVSFAAVHRYCFFTAGLGQEILH
jgi:hypothetical protein